MALGKKTADELLYRSLRSIYHFERALEERFGLGYQGIYLLQLLRRRESARVGEIASALGIQVFTATRLVQRLEARGFVSRRRDGEDSRVVAVRLEPLGDRFVRGIEKHNYELVSSIGSTLSADELEAFVVVARDLDLLLGVRDRIDADP